MLPRRIFLKHFFTHFIIFYFIIYYFFLLFLFALLDSKITAHPVFPYSKTEFWISMYYMHCKRYADIEPTNI